MKRKLALVNLALAALVVLAIWQLRLRWLEARAREAAFRRQPVQAAPAAPFVPVAPAPRVAALDYVDVAQKMLFSKDRNPAVEIEVAPAKPMPSLPVAYGLMAFGDVRSALLAPRPGAPHRAYSPGESVGEFKVVSISPEEIVFEWDGQTIVKKLEEIMVKDRGSSSASLADAAQAAPAPQPAATTVVAAPVRPGPGVQLTSEMKACQPGDSSPPGTVMDGMRKIVTKTPFGESCRWEVVR